MTIHPDHPFAEPEALRDPARRLRGRLGGAVTLWTTGQGTGQGIGRTGLTVSSALVAPGDPAHVLGLVDPDSDLAVAVETTGAAVVALLSWGHRDLADAFAGVAPAPGGPFRGGTWQDTEWGPVLEGVSAWAGIRLTGPRADVGWSVLLDGVVEHVHLSAGPDPDPDPDADPEVAAGSGAPLVHRRGRYLRPGGGGAR